MAGITIRMRVWFTRVLVLVAAGGAVAAGYLAVRSALRDTTSSISAAKAADATVSAQTVVFGHDRVVTKVKPGGLACFKVLQGSSTVAASCFGALAADAVVYAASRTAVGGRAGPGVKAVIVRLTRKGTVWAQLRRGAFYARIPKGHRPTKVIKVLADGTRKTFLVGKS